MAAPTLVNAVEELLNPETDPSQQLTALKLLKNGIIGHPLKKELLARHGLLEGLRLVLGVPEARLRSVAEIIAAQSARHETPPSGELHEEIRFQAITIIGSLAHGMF